MGNSSSSGRSHQDETVDFGYLTPQGVYTGPRDWNQSIVSHLIVDRKLAPFYRPLEDYEESWDDDQILAHMKEPQPQESTDPDQTGTRADAASIVSSSSKTHHKRPSASSREVIKEQPRHPELGIYHGATDCPICFLYYPANINRSRCCDQAICTECFVQIKRADPTTTHLVSEPASCPYCVQENFGVVYTPPSWRAGLGSEGWPPPMSSDIRTHVAGASNPTAAMKKRRRSFGADAPEVVTTDQIRPDWEAKLAAVRATVARRANRRIVMRQVGDRLIPVGITSGRVHALPPDEAQGEQAEGGSDRGSRRSRRRQPNQELSQLLGQMGLGGQDIEELMIMEAMRLSLIDHEEQQKKQKEEEENKNRKDAEAPASETTEGAGSSSRAASDAVPSLLSPSSPSQPASGTASAHRSSSSLSRVSLDPSTASRRSPSPRPMSALETALRSVTSAASAVVSPSADHEEPPASNSSPKPLIPQIVHTEVPTEPELTVEPSATPSTSEQTAPVPETTTSSGDQLTASRGAERPNIRTMSFSSSVLSEETQNGEAYDYLPSSPSSSTSSLVHKANLSPDLRRADESSTAEGQGSVNA